MSSEALSPRPFAPSVIGEPAPGQSPEGVLPDHLSRLEIGTDYAPPLQPKLTMGAPNDPYEQEADRVAQQVVQKIHGNPSHVTTDQPLQREMKPDDDEELQMKSNGEGAIVEGEASTEVEAAIHSARGQGQPLDPALQRQMGQVMNADFSGVTVHTDSRSDQLNQSIQAKAFTTGQDIFFRDSAYQPTQPEGQKLIAHELTHVIQQQGSQIQRKPIKPSAPSKMTPEQIRHANRIRRVRGLPPIPMPQALVNAPATPNQGANQPPPSDDSPEMEDVAPLPEAEPLAGPANPEVVNQDTPPPDEQQNAAVVSEEMGGVPIPKTLEELALNLEAGQPVWSTSDDVLLAILLGPLRANWFLAKDCLAMNKWPGGFLPPHKPGIDLMQDLVNMRGRKWDAFAKKTVPLIQAEVVRIANTQQQVFSNTQGDLINSANSELSIGEAVGSQSVTSDLDLSLKGNNTEIGVGLLNEAFRKEFKVPFDPGTVFDINVYSLDWMHGQTEVTQNPETASIATFNPEPEQRSKLAAPKDQQARSDTMEIWSLVKIRRNMTPQQWATYEQTTLAAIEDENARAAMDKKLIEAEFEYQTFRVMVETKLEAMDAELKQQEAELGYQMNGHDEHQEEARAMRASNAIYQDIVLQVRNIRLRLDQLHQDPEGNYQAIVNLSKQLAYKIAEGLTYANEVYATEGAVLHTVYGKQGAKKKLGRLKEETVDGPNGEKLPKRPNLEAVKFNLTPEHYMQSVDENVGDSLHSLNHYGHDPAYAVYRAGKYLERLCEATDFLLTEQVAVTLPHYLELKNIGVQSVKSKDGPVGKDPTAVYTDEFFKNFVNATQLEELKTKVLTFGAKASATFHGQTKAQPSTQQAAPLEPAMEETPPVNQLPANQPSEVNAWLQTVMEVENILNKDNPN